MDRALKNIPHSIHDRLLRISKEQNQDFNLTLIQFVAERFLFRLGRSEYRQRFILKGAMLLAVTLEDQQYRPTKDVDFLRNGTVDPVGILNDILIICLIDDASDGLNFDTNDATIEEIREHNLYQGLRVKIPVLLGKAKVSLQIDVGLGDAVHPAPEEIHIPSILGQDEPDILAYPLQSVIAEKLEAIVSIGMITSRMKDFYDLYAIATTQVLDSSDLLLAIEATFSRRQTNMPAEVPEVLSDKLAKDSTKRAQWAAFLRRIERSPAKFPLETVLPVVRDLASIMWDQRLKRHVSTWEPKRGWN